MTIGLTPDYFLLFRALGFCQTGRRLFLEGRSFSASVLFERAQNVSGIESQIFTRKFDPRNYASAEQFARLALRHFEHCCEPIEVEKFLLCSHQYQ